MKTLPILLTRKRLTYRQIDRTSKNAFYSASKAESPETIIGYEVFKIVVVPLHEYQGKQIGAKERYPRDEDFGNGAKSFFGPGSLERASALYFKTRRAKHETSFLGYPTTTQGEIVAPSSKGFVN